MIRGIEAQPFFFSFWINAGNRKYNELREIIKKYYEFGFSEILAGGSVVQMKILAELCEATGMTLQHWHMVMVNNDENILKNHRDWFTINALGQRSADHPPYVGYYRWLCPNHPEVLPYLRGIVKEYCEIPGLSGFHLDYIRYSDVILPVKCQKQYGLVQKKEEPEFDFCYCSHCRSRFQARYGYDILEQKDTVSDLNWLQFRYDSITNIVKDLSSLVHSSSRKITAAVFPTPGIARDLVRQDWSQWPLDAVYPMMYHEFYEKENTWLLKAVAECRNESSLPLHAGIHLPTYTPETLRITLKMLMGTDIQGISFFEYNSLSQEKLGVIKEFLIR